MKHLRRIFPLLLLALLPLPLSSGAFTMRLSGDRLWLEAEDTPLVDILREFARLGVQVRVDPALDQRITSRIQGRKLEEALPRLLTPSDYLLTWKVLRGPLGNVPKLEEIAIFAGGASARTARPLRREPYRFPVTRGVTGRGPEFVKDELLLGVRPGTTFEQFRILLDQIGGTIVSVDPTTGVYLIRFPEGTNVEELLARLQQNPMLTLAELNHVQRANSPDRAVTLTDNASALASQLAGANPEGQALVAVLDSGFNAASPLSGIVQSALDATSPGQTITDDNGHGTLMSYLAAGLYDGADLDSLQTVIPIKTYDDTGATSTFALLLALAYAAESGARVINMSWGTDTPSDALRTAIYNAAQNGLLLIASAGNDGTATAKYPAAYDTVLSVAGTMNGRPWSGSNHGDTINLSAPATAILPGTTQGGLVQSTGTSVSSALVANALARYLAKYPASTQAQAVEALMNSLSPPVAAGYGAGTLDAAALRRLLGN